MDFGRNQYQLSETINELTVRIRILERIYIATKHLGLSKKSLRAIEWKTWLASRLLKSVVRFLDDIANDARSIVNPKLQKLITKPLAERTASPKPKTRNGWVTVEKLDNEPSPIIKLFDAILSRSIMRRAERVEFAIDRKMEYPQSQTYCLVSGTRQEEQPLPSKLWESLIELLHFHCNPTATVLHQPNGSFDLRFGDMTVHCAVTFSHPDPRDATSVSIELTYIT